MKAFTTFFALMFLILHVNDLCATGVISARSAPDGKPAQSSLLHPVGMAVSTTIEDQIATTKVRETFIQESYSSAQLEYSFPLSARASISDVKLRIDGREYLLTISSSPVDTSSGSAGSSGTKSEAQVFFAKAGYPQTPFTLPISSAVAFRSRVEIEFTYIELLSYTLGLSTFQFPLKSLTSNAHLRDSLYSKDFTLELTIASGMKLDTAWSSSHADAQLIQEKNYAGLIYKLSSDDGGSQRVTRDFVLQFRVAQDDVRSSFFSTKPANEDGHFVFLLRPSANTEATEILSKTFTFIIDISGSMTGTKLRQAKEAASYCIANLNRQDTFNIIAFETNVRTFAARPVAAHPLNVASALDYIGKLQANGGTNLQDAALRGLSQYTNPNSVNIIIFLTDGIADLDQSRVRSANTMNVHIHVFGIGRDVNSQQLAQLAAQNNGLSQFIEEEALTSTVIGSFYNRIRNPMWTHVSVSVSPVAVSDVLPLQIPDLTVGEQLCISGRYTGGGDAVITVHGLADARIIEAQYPVHFSVDSSSDLFCSKIWARMRIEYLLQLMAKEVPQSARWLEWRSEIVRLGLRYGLVTEFTTYKDTGTVSEVDVQSGEHTDLSAFPNPFTTTTNIHYTVHDAAHVHITIQDAQAKQVIVLRDEYTMPGEYTAHWDGRTESGEVAASGTYYCTIQIGQNVQTLTLTIAR